MLFQGQINNVPTERLQTDSLYLWDKKTWQVEKGKGRTLDEKIAIVFLKICSEIFLVSPVMGQEVNLFPISQGWSVCLESTPRITSR